MAEDKFDAIIVGGGLAGIVTAYQLVKEGLEVLVVERGTACGSKNMTGGRLYAHTMEKVIPGFADEAPLGRKIVTERFSLLTADNSSTIEVDSEKLGEMGAQSYTVLRAEFDQWLADKAESEGVMFVCGIRVDDLIVRDGTICGIIAGDEEMEADVVVLADGVNSLLAQRLGLKEELRPDEVEVGAKEVIRLGDRVIEERFHLAPGEGIAWVFHGEATFGHKGNGFLYTNRDTVSLGVVTGVDDIDHSGHSVLEMVEHLKEHPLIAPLIAGGDLAEYSAHLVPRGGPEMMPKLFDSGVLVVGDAAALVINLGYIVRGMDLAVQSAILAAETILAARAAGDFSKSTLCAYEKAVQESFILRDMKHCQAYAQALESPALYDDPVHLTTLLTQAMNG